MIRELIGIHKSHAPVIGIPHCERTPVGATGACEPIPRPLMNVLKELQERARPRTYNGGLTLLSSSTKCSERNALYVTLLLALEPWSPDKIVGGVRGVHSDCIIHAKWRERVVYASTGCTFCRASIVGTPAPNSWELEAPES